MQKPDAQNPKFVRGVFESIAHRYDYANHVLSGGLDFLWRRRAAQVVKGWSPRCVLDLATGSGDLALAISRHCPNATVIGADFCFPLLLKSREKKVAHLIAADGLRLPFADQTFDAVTVAFGLRNMESWSAALREMRRVLKDGGHLLVLDFSLPRCAPMRALYRIYLHRCLPLIAAAVTGRQPAYAYLARSIEDFPSGGQMLRLIEDCGYRDASAEELAGGIVTLYTTTSGFTPNEAGASSPT